MRKFFFVAVSLLAAAPAWAAEEPSGCDKFKWNIDHERAALTAPDRVKLSSSRQPPASRIDRKLTPSYLSRRCFGPSVALQKPE